MKDILVKTSRATGFNDLRVYEIDVASLAEVAKSFQVSYAPPVRWRTQCEMSQTDFLQILERSLLDGSACKRPNSVREEKPISREVGVPDLTEFIAASLEWQSIHVHSL